MYKFVVFIATIYIAIFIFTGCATNKANGVLLSAPKNYKNPDPVLYQCSNIAASGAGKIPQWELVSSPNTYDKETIFDYIDGAAELYFAYDFRGIAAVEYKNNETSIIVDIYDMTSPEGAFGIYSLNRDQKANYVNAGNEGILSGTALDFWKGRYFCKVYSLSMSEKYQPVVMSFANILATEIEDAGAEPAIMSKLPLNNQIPKSAKFFMKKLGLDNINFISEENILNLSDDTRGAVAEYIVGNSKFKVFIIQYLSSDNALLAFDNYSEFLEKDGKLISNVESDQERAKLFQIEDTFTGLIKKDQILYGFWEVDSIEITIF